MSEENKEPEEIEVEGALEVETQIETNPGEVTPEDTADSEVVLEEVVEEEDWQAKYNEANDTYLRTVAENENFKKRVLRDRQNEKATASKDAVMAMLPVIDNLERAVSATRSQLAGAEAEGTLKQMLEGVELTLKTFEGALEKLDVKRIECELNKPFDPNLHQALFQEPNADVDEGSVLEILQGGFSLGGQVIRPTMVKVSRKP